MTKRTGQACSNPHCDRTDRYKTKSGYRPPFYPKPALCHRCYAYLHTVMKRTPTWVMQRDVTVKRWTWLLDRLRPSQVKRKATQKKTARKGLRAA